MTNYLIWTLFLRSEVMYSTIFISEILSFNFKPFLPSSAGVATQTSPDRSIPRSPPGPPGPLPSTPSLPSSPPGPLNGPLGPK